MGMTTLDFHENLTKMTWENRVFERLDVLFTKYEHESSLFYREWALLSYGLREMIFSWKLRKKRASYLLFWSIMYCRFDRINVFLDQIWAWQQEVFHKILKQITWKHIVFERMNVFLTKYGHEISVFFSEWTFFWQNLGIRAGIFWLKNRIERISYWLLWPII